MRAFVASGSAHVLLPVVAILGGLRLVIGDWGRGDVAVALAIIVQTGFVEWFIHLFVLHAPVDAWTSRRLGTGSGHRQHHLDPPDLKWLLLPPLDAAIFVVVLGVWSAAWAVPLVWADRWHRRRVNGDGGRPRRDRARPLRVDPPPGSRRVPAEIALLPRLARNHRWHHYRNERYWLGVTSNLGDRVLRTLPADRADVPLSDTARYPRLS